MQTLLPSGNSENRSGPRTTIDLLDLFWRRRIYIIWCMLIGFVAGVIYCGLADPVYESTADVLVVQKRPQAVTGDSQYESGFEDYLAIHLAIIGSPLIVERAIAASDLASLESFADLEDPEEDLVDAIIDSLEVKGGSRDLGESADSIMTVSFWGPVPEDCPVVVQALLDSYEEFHDEVYRGMSESTVDLIKQARDLLNIDLVEQEKSYNTFRQTSPLVARGDEEVNPLQDRLTAIEDRRSQLLLRRAEMERQLLALEQAKTDGDDYQQLLAMVSELRQLATIESGLPNVSTALENQLIQLVDDEKRLLEHYGPNHPHVAMIRERIGTTRRLFALPTTAHMQETVSTEETAAGSTDPVAVYTQYLEQELKRLNISEKLLTDLYNREHEAAKEHSIFQLKDYSFQRAIERTEALYEVVVNRLQEASLIKEFGGFETRVIAPPRLGMKVGPSRRIIVPVTAFAGMLLGCALAFFFELRDGSFHSSEQVQQQLGDPVIGQIPQFAAVPKSVWRAADDSSCHPMLCSYYQPRSFPAESFRMLRNALCLNRQGETRVIQVTGAGPEDGASTVAANLAISLAQAGKQVLLIDADLSQQRQSQLFGLDDPEMGLATTVVADAEPADVIWQTAVNNLWLLPAGSLPAGSCELFTMPRFGELMTMFRESYDHVLIDTESLEVASDPCVIAAHTDGVLLTLRLTRDSRRRAKRAKQMLEGLNVKTLGIVINRISRSTRKRHQMKAKNRTKTPRNTPSPLPEQQAVTSGE